MDKKTISLAIYGNQNSNSGFQPLYWLNHPPCQLENLVPPGMEENPWFYVLENSSTHTQFTLIQNHVSSYMSVRPGVLKMAIALPQGYRIMGDKSPLEVLLRVRQTFVSNCMTQKSAFSDTLQFKHELPGTDMFMQIINGYELEPVSTSCLRPMRGSSDALLLLDEEHTSLLFKDVQYPQFEPFARIVIGTKGKKEAYQKQITELVIPRPADPEPLTTDSPPLTNHHSPQAATNDSHLTPHPSRLDTIIEKIQDLFFGRQADNTINNTTAI